MLDAVADRRLGAAAASSALERCAGPPGVRAVARSVLAARGAERRRRAARAAFAARRTDASSIPDAPDVRALSDARRAASLALARAAVDAHSLEFNEPLITCATPELVASLNLVDDARYGAVLIDEASQFPTTPLALDLCAAASLTFVAAGDDLQLPPRRHAEACGPRRRPLLAIRRAPDRAPLVVGHTAHRRAPRGVAHARALLRDSRLEHPPVQRVLMRARDGTQFRELGRRPPAPRSCSGRAVSPAPSNSRSPNNSAR